MSAVDKKSYFEKYLSVLNQHNLEETLIFFDDHFELLINHQPVAKGLDQMRAMLTSKFSEPNYSYQVEKFFPSDDDDQIHVQLKTHDNQHLDVTYTLSKETPRKYIRTSAEIINVPLEG